MKEHRICSSLLNPESSATTRSDLRVFETPPRCFYAYRFHGLRWSSAPLLRIGPRKVPRAHVNLFRESANSEIAVQMFSYPAVK